MKSKIVSVVLLVICFCLRQFNLSYGAEKKVEIPEGSKSVIESYEEDIRINPDDASAHYSLGLYYYVTNNYPRAIESFKQVIRIKPDYADAYKGLGDAYSGLKDYPKAIESYKEAISIKPDYIEAHNGLERAYDGFISIGLHYEISGDYQKAVESYKQVIRIKPDYAEAHKRLGDAYNGAKDYPKAIESYKEAISINPDYADAYYNLGSIYKDLEDYPKAIESYKQAIRIKPDHAEAHYSLGGVYDDLEDYPKAIESYKQAISTSVAHNSRGKTYADSGDLKKASKSYIQAVSLDSAYNSLGFAYEMLGDYPKAIASYKEAIRISPNYAYAHYCLGRVYKYIGDRVSASEEYKILKGLDEKFADKLFSASLSVEEGIQLLDRCIKWYEFRKKSNEDLEKAFDKIDRESGLEPPRSPRFTKPEVSSINMAGPLAKFNEAIQIDPKYLPAYFYKSYCYRFIGNTKQAISIISEAINIDDNFYEGYKTRGDLKALLRQYEPAIEDFSKAILLQNNYAEAYVSRGRAYFEIGERPKALEDLEKAIGFNSLDQGTKDYSETIKLVIKGPSWRQTFSNGTKYFILKTDTSQAKCKDYALKLEAIIKSIISTIKLKEQVLLKPKAEVFVFGGKQDYHTYAKLTTGGEMENALGYYSPSYRQLFLYEQLDQEKGTSQTMYHEGFHMVLDRYAKNTPPWLNEGLAEYFSGAVVRLESGVHQVFYDRLLKGRVGNIQWAIDENKMLSFQEIMNETAEEFYNKDDKDNPAIKYAQAWSMCYFFLHHRNAKYAKNLCDYFYAIINGNSPEDAFKEGFGKTDMANMEKEWRNYVMTLRAE